MSERLWAPWRMQFVLGSEPGSGCALCGLSAEVPSRSSRVLAKRPGAFVALNAYPYAAGHLMVISSRHVGDLCELESAEHDRLWRLVRDALGALREAVAPEGVNIGVNSGAAAGAGIVDHVHVHLVPRWVGDTSFMPVLADVRVLPEYLDATWDRLAPAFARLSETP